MKKIKATKTAKYAHREVHKPHQFCLAGQTYEVDDYMAKRIVELDGGAIVPTFDNRETKVEDPAVDETKIDEPVADEPVADESVEEQTQAEEEQTQAEEEQPPRNPNIRPRKRR